MWCFLRVEHRNKFVGHQPAIFVGICLIKSFFLLFFCADCEKRTRENLVRKNLKQKGWSLVCKEEPIFWKSQEAPPPPPTSHETTLHFESSRLVRYHVICVSVITCSVQFTEGQRRPIAVSSWRLGDTKREGEGFHQMTAKHLSTGTR